MKNQFEQQKKIAIEAVTKAAYLCYQVQKELVGSEKGHVKKQDRSPVTVADYGSQAIICHILKETFPNDIIVAEENSSLLRLQENKSLLNSTIHYVEMVVEEKMSKEQIFDWIDLGTGNPADCFWALDPIDGTKGFLRGNQYAVALGLIVDGQLKFGLLACPNLLYSSPGTNLSASFASGSLFIGTAGQGASIISLDGKKSRSLRVSDNDNPARVRFIESYEPAHSDHQMILNILQNFKNKVTSTRMDSQAKYGLLAEGAVDVYIRLPLSKNPHYLEKIWDHAAGALIVEASGGKVTDIHGKPLDFSLGKELTANKGIVASNGRIHGIIIESIQK